MAVLLQPARIEWYSPYQVLELSEGPTLHVNHTYFQRLLDGRPPGEKDDVASRYYGLPYRLKPAPRRVLVVGSGTGNDVAAALRNGAEHVDALEIDPVIVHLGRTVHPERPYLDPRVRVIVNDARAFLRASDASYDLIVYGLLDSHTSASTLSSTRLDSFVYTVEGFRDARRHLAPDGLMTVTFCVVTPALLRKLSDMMEAAFDGARPRVYETHYDEGWMLVEGLGTAAAGLTDRADDLRRNTTPVVVSTDDWPFLYMTRRIYPWSYGAMLALAAAASWGLVRLGVPTRRLRATPFFLGAGFMLVETLSISSLGLIYGNTSQVVAVVVAGVLVMAMLANATARVWRPPALLPYVAVLGALAAAYFCSGEVTSPPVALLLATLPIYFGGLAFSLELAADSDVTEALAANLLGAMAGGFLEYNCLYFGLRALLPCAGALYAAAWLSRSRR